MKTLSLRITLFASLILAGGLAPAGADDRIPGSLAEGEFKVQPQIAAPDSEAIFVQFDRWLASRQARPATRKAAAVWLASLSEAPAEQRLEAVVSIAASVDPLIDQLAKVCAQPRENPWVPEQPWLFSQTMDPWMRDQLRCWYGRWLAQHDLYDEAMEQLAGVRVETAIDPASLLFYQGVVYHRLLYKKEGLVVLDQLLNDTAQVPKRYLAVAALMRGDLQQLEDDSLDHIARRMDDIRRRLELARAGDRVVMIEDSVIKSLDKLIEEMEKQQQQQSGGGGGGGNADRPSSPMPDSRVARAQGAGDVDRRNIGNTAGWGDLPPKQREEALQQIGKEFPAHYRDVIEQYFRKLASDEVPPPSR